MAESVRLVTVCAEPVTWEAGLWCRRCALPSAVRAYVAVTAQGRLSLLTRDQCRDCGSHDVEARS